ncbi:MAG: hypothetical protein GXY25_04625 [Pirellulaceae bacterium]|jgi:Tfp pilus assembly protein PilX|nr:hypothetical protein [Thermoguttaceae bacterium]NLY99801.1 hypothetical protein [Pirellulaceae bacterium]
MICPIDSAEPFAPRLATPGGGFRRGTLRGPRRPVVADRVRRAGSVLALVLASLLVASMLGLALLKTVLVHHRQARLLGGQHQALWLAEAGVQRAIRGLAASPDYEGETWEVTAETLGAARPAVVTIQVAKSESKGDRTIRVEARLGRAPEANVYRRELAVRAAQVVNPETERNRL